MSSEPSLYQSCQSRPFQIPLCWVLLIAFDLCLMAFAMAQEPQQGSANVPVQTDEFPVRRMLQKTPFASKRLMSFWIPATCH